MNTPSHHRVHHGRNPACIDRNYAGVFIIWDRMFGNLFVYCNQYGQLCTDVRYKACRVGLHSEVRLICSII